MPPGLLPSKARPANVSRHTCWQVVMVRQAPGGNHGSWEVVTTKFGYQVVCATKKDAIELKLRIGGAVFTSPHHIVDDEGYERWLDQFIRVQPVSTFPQTRWCWDWDLIRGWWPTADELLRGTNESAEEWGEHVAEMARKRRSIDMLAGGLNGNYLNR